MKPLLYSGVLYLAGVAIILLLQPELMFTKEGTWKEFGIGRDKHKYTWMPFWLFTIIWAILSYLIVISLTDYSDTSSSIASVPNMSISDSLTTQKSVRSTAPINLQSGYYILDVEESAKKGFPKYIFLGPEAPNIIYNNGVTE
jgi:hypothetical protein